MRLLLRHLRKLVFCIVSVPLPGFSGLRLARTRLAVGKRLRFSPVAGIQWVETTDSDGRAAVDRACFSPVAGIQWVET